MADFHLLWQKSASSCPSILSQKDNSWTMKNLPWKPFFFFFFPEQERQFLATGGESEAPRRRRVTCDHGGPRQDEQKGESCALRARVQTE